MMTRLDPYATNRIDPKKARFVRSPSGLLQVTLDGILHEDVTALRLYPLSHPNRFIQISLPSGDELGIIDDLSEVEATSREAIEQELRLLYVVPVVTQIHKISQEPGIWRWQVSTDRGDMLFLLPNLHDHVQAIAEDRLLIQDPDGRRCEVRPAMLDNQSRLQLRKVQ